MVSSTHSQTPALLFNQPQQEKQTNSDTVIPIASSVSISIASDHSLLEIDHELDLLFERVQEEFEQAGADRVSRIDQPEERFGEECSLKESRRIYPQRSHVRTFPGRAKLGCEGRGIAKPRNVRPNFHRDRLGGDRIDAGIIGQVHARHSEQLSLRIKSRFVTRFVTDHSES